MPARPTPTPGRKPRPEPTRPMPTPGRPPPIRASAAVVATRRTPRLAAASRAGIVVPLHNPFRLLRMFISFDCPRTPASNRSFRPAWGLSKGRPRTSNTSIARMLIAYVWTCRRNIHWLTFSQLSPPRPHSLPTYGAQTAFWRRAHDPAGNAVGHRPVRSSGQARGCAARWGRRAADERRMPASARGAPRPAAARPGAGEAPKPRKAAHRGAAGEDREGAGGGAAT